MFIQPEEILDQIKLESEMIVVDFGAGSGGWSIPVAKIVDEGMVYAFDILEEPLSVLKKRAASENVFNIQTKIVNLEKEGETKLREESVDLVIMSNILFQINDKKAALKEAKRILKKDGNILIIDWLKSDKFGPEEKETVLKEDVENLADNMNLELKEELDGGNYHYALLFKKL